MPERQLGEVPEAAVALVFDPIVWGGRDQGDNAHCWKPATILRVRGSGVREVADVRFHHDGRESRGHFTDAIRTFGGEPDER